MTSSPVDSADPLATSGLVVVDKPHGMTSHDVVAKLRRAMGTRKVGHAGTLDPMATGVLVAGINRGTKVLTHLVGLDKTYEATIRFGQMTTTEDAEGDITAEHDASHLTHADVVGAFGYFRGAIMQRPSSVSAIKIDGKRAHQRVRDGEDVVIPAREVTIYSLDALDRLHVHDGIADLKIRVRCSSGTYVRALARDLGVALSVGAHLTALRRTAVGPFSLDNAVTLEELADNPHLTHTVDEALLACYPALEVTDQEWHDLAQGKWLEPRGVKTTHAATNSDGKVVALVKESGKRLATTFVARPSTL